MNLLMVLMLTATDGGGEVIDEFDAEGLYCPESTPDEYTRGAEFFLETVADPGGTWWLNYQAADEAQNQASSFRWGVRNQNTGEVFEPDDLVFPPQYDAPRSFQYSVRDGEIDGTPKLSPRLLEALPAPAEPGSYDLLVDGGDVGVTLTVRDVPLPVGAGSVQVSETNDILYLDDCRISCEANPYGDELLHPGAPFFDISLDEGADLFAIVVRTDAESEAAIPGFSDDETTGPYRITVGTQSIAGVASYENLSDYWIIVYDPQSGREIDRQLVAVADISTRREPAPR